MKDVRGVDLVSGVEVVVSKNEGYGFKRMVPGVVIKLNPKTVTVEYHNGDEYVEGNFVNHNIIVATVPAN